MNQDAEFVRYQQLCERIKNLDTAYYAGEPKVPDVIYDGIIMEMKGLELQLGIAEDQIELPQVGHVHATTLEEHVHRRPMLSLCTEVDSSEKGFVAFDARIRRELMIPVGETIEYITEMKFDGLGLNLQYVKGILHKILTRGNGEVGENVTHALPMFGDSIRPDISKYYPYDIEIRGEALITLDDFKELNKSLEAIGAKPMSNARNAAAGSVRTLDLEKVKTRKMLFFPYSIGAMDGPGLGKTQSETMGTLFKWGFVIMGEGGYVSQTHGSPTDLGPYAFFQKISQDRATLGIEIDGVVHKVNRLDLQEKLGFRSKEPRWAVAQKFPPETVVTTLYAIDVQVGRTGKLTPVGKVMPVQVGGVVVSKATLHNLFDLRRRGVRVGDRVTIQRAGDVIPEIAYRMETEPRLFYVPNFHFPKFCPSCGSRVLRNKGETAHYCSGKAICQEQIIGSLEHFASRDAMDIQGMGEVLITTLVKKGVLRDYLGIYKVPEEVYAVEGEIGTLLARKLMINIEASKRNYAWQFLYGLGIKEIGRTASKLVCLAHPLYMVPVIAQAGPHSVRETTRLGQSASQCLCHYFKNESDLVRFRDFLSLPGLALKVPNTTAQLAGMVVLFTGSFQDFGREQLKTMVENKGGKTTSSVTGKTNYVVVGENATQHKVEKAKSLGIPVVTMAEFQNILKG